MSIEKIINLIEKNLDEEIKGNLILEKVLSTYIDTYNQANKPLFYIELDKNLYEKIPEFKDLKNIKSDNSLNENIINISTDKDSLFFSLFKKEHYNVVLSKLNILKDDKVEIIEIVSEIALNNDSLVKIVRSIVDSDDYCYSYDVDLILYDKDGNKKEITDLDNEKDKDFSEEFGISLNEARKCRLNFDKYRDFLNNSKSCLSMKTIDNVFTNKSCLFSPVFKMTDFYNFILDTSSVDDEDDYEDEIEEDEEVGEIKENNEENVFLEKSSLKAKNLAFKLKQYLGDVGEFTLSYNLYLNIKTYLLNKNSIINTSGLIIRKIDNNYTVFYTSFINEDLFLIKKEMNYLDVKKLYESDPMNEKIDGVYEFFNNGKKYTLKPDNNTL